MVALQKKLKAETKVKQGKQKEDAAGEQSAGKKPAGKKAPVRKPAVKKAAKKKAPIKKPTGNDEEAASLGVVSSKANVAKGKKKLPAQRVPGESKGKRAPGKHRTIALSEGSGPGTAEMVELDPFEVAKQTMKGSVPAIVKAMVAKAKQGSCTHAKTLLEMTGAKHMFSDEAAVVESGEPWAKLVLERMDEAEQKSSQSDPREVAAER